MPETTTRATDQPTWLLKKIMEQGVIASIAAAVAIYANDTRQDADIRALRETVAELRIEIRRANDELREALRALAIVHPPKGRL